MDGIQVSNCITELTGPTITLGLATPLAGGGMLQELCAAAAVELAVMVGLYNYHYFSKSGRGWNFNRIAYCCC